MVTGKSKLYNMREANRQTEKRQRDTKSPGYTVYVTRHFMVGEDWEKKRLNEPSSRNQAKVPAIGDAFEDTF